MSRRNKKGGGLAIQWLLYAIFGLITTWLLASVYFKKRPKDLFDKENPSKVPAVNVEKLLVDNAAYTAQIHKMEKELKKCRGNQGYPPARVNIKSSYVNMRDDASLTSSVIAKLADSTLVRIMYYGTETFFLEGKQGKWCRIQYADKEGWVWGNFLEEIEE